jgi:type I restriction enzyme R subunit
MSQTTEKAFESYVEHMLLFPAHINAFIAATQTQLWESLRGQHGANLETLINE